MLRSNFPYNSAPFGGNFPYNSGWFSGILPKNAKTQKIALQAPKGT